MLDRGVACWEQVPCNMQTFSGAVEFSGLPLQTGTL